MIIGFVDECTLGEYKNFYLDDFNFIFIFLFIILMEKQLGVFVLF